MDNPENVNIHISDQFSELHDDIRSVRDSLDQNMREMAEALTKLVQFEERQLFIMKAHEASVKRSEKAEEELDKLELRVESLERDAPLQRTVNKWVLGAVYSIAISAVLGVMHFFKFFG